MIDEDAIYARLQQLPHDIYVFVDGRFYTYGHDRKPKSYVDRTDLYSTEWRRNGRPVAMSPHVMTVVHDGDDVYCGGEDAGHGSLGFVARFDADTRLIWLVSHERNPVVDIQLIDDHTLRCVSNNDIEYELPRDITPDNLDRIDLFPSL